MLYGVDIHPRYQSGINIARLKEQGYSFVAVKATEGTGIPHNSAMSAAAFKARLLRWIRQAQDVNLVVGLYHWLKAGDAAAQAKFFFNVVKEAGGPKGMLIQLDCEDNAKWSDVKAWAAAWQSLSGGHPFLLYTGKWWWDAAGRRWDGNSVTPYLWDSHYIGDDQNTAQDDPAAQAARIPKAWWTPDYGNWPKSTCLQFTSKGDAGGLTNNVDLNAFPGTMADLLKLTQPHETATEELTMWCKHGDRDVEGAEGALGNRVHALQGRLIEAGAAELDDNGGTDGIFGDATAAAMVEVLGAVAGDGKVYGWQQSNALDAWLRELVDSDAALVAHTHPFDPAAGNSGPAVASS